MAELGWEAGVMITVLVIGLIVMVLDLVQPDFVFSAMVGVLMASRVISEWHVSASSLRGGSWAAPNGVACQGQYALFNSSLDRCLGTGNRG